MAASCAILGQYLVVPPTKHFTDFYEFVGEGKVLVGLHNASLLGDAEQDFGGVKNLNGFLYMCQFLLFRYKKC